MKIGLLGLGKMGSRIAEKLVRDSHQVIVWNHSVDAVDRLKSLISIKYQKISLLSAQDIQELVNSLEKPRIIWMMLPAGKVTQSTLDEVVKYSEPGDIIIDGGNSYYKDTERRCRELGAKGIRFLGIGVSGGIKAFENGYPMMAGGDVSAYQYITTILDSLAKPNGGHAYFGEGGAGHFVKMVHNGIEYGMMQAIAEGFGVLEKAPYRMDLPAIAKLWQKGTIIESFLMDCAKDALEKDARLETIDGIIDATGEAEWTVEQGKEERVPVENIEQSLDFRRRSKTDKKVAASFAARMVAALRHEFGGHMVKTKNIDK